MSLLSQTYNNSIKPASQASETSVTSYCSWSWHNAQTFQEKGLGK
jgi:hypothetical protein